MPPPRVCGSWRRGKHPQQNKQEKARFADAMFLPDDLIVRSYPTLRPAKLTAPSSTWVHEARDHPTDLEDRPAFASQTWHWHVERAPFQQIGGPEDWDSGIGSRHSSAGQGGFYAGRTYDDGDDVDDDHLLKMSTWAGQPKVEGRSETMRMVLLTCVSIGITSVHIPCPGMQPCSC